MDSRSRAVRVHRRVAGQYLDPRSLCAPGFESRLRRVLPGRGVFELAWFVRVLDEVGFDGSVSVEGLPEESRTL
jgi:sugar phosphate isomerase/epimerase